MNNDTKLKFIDYYESQHRPIIKIKSLNLLKINLIFKNNVNNGTYLNKNKILDSFIQLIQKFS